MKNIRIRIVASLIIMVSSCGDKPGADIKAAATKAVAVDAENGGKLLRATYSPLHFKPAIESASDDQCLACHKEVLEDKPRVASLGISGQVLIAVIRTLSIGGI